MINLIDYGFIPSMLSQDAIGMPARIMAVQKQRYELICEFGTAWGRVKSSVYYTKSFENFPTTGDFVMINYNSSGDSQILKTLDRHSFFSRRDPTPGRGEQAVAANFDYVFILSSFNQDYNVRRIERYLTLAWQSRAIPVVILNKADLQGDCSKQMRAVEDIAPGVGIYAVSAKTGYGLTELSELLTPRKTVVFLGSSGVGKSSLVNALAGEQIMPVNEIREDDSRGRHTTTHRQLIMLPSGAMVIDTPGMRELGMWDVSNGLGEAFADVEEFIGKCRFPDCRHETEPGCAIKEAIQNGELMQQRWNSYLKLKKEAKFTDDWTAAMREKDERVKLISKWIRQKKKNGEINK